jgi:hypothetical protein
MSQPVGQTKPMQDLIERLDLEKLEENLFRGSSPQNGWQRVFGGLVIAQSLMAAQRCVDTDRIVHSLPGRLVLHHPARRRRAAWQGDLLDVGLLPGGGAGL